MENFLKNIIIFIKLFRESLIFAVSSIVSNKLRTILSLLGVTIGIFAIISMYTAIDALQANIGNSLSAIGNDVIYIERYPWTPEDGGEYKWWKYMQRPRNKYDEFTYIQQYARTISSSAAIIGFSREVKYKSKVASNCYLLGCTHDWEKVAPPTIMEGRYFSLLESQSGKNVSVLGAVVAEELFGEASPIGKEIKIRGLTSRVIGVLEKEGDNILSVNNFDNAIMIPFNFSRNFVNINRGNPTIVVKAKAGVSNDEMSAEMRQILRSLRRTKPLQEDSFALNELSVLKSMTDSIFGMINVGGTIIGLFSLLVGGFGIANIMFVSVKERTNIIGIQKALGAKKYFILTQFLAEAALLAIMGGMIGLLLIWAGASIVSSVTSFQMTLTLGNITRGVLISGFIGIASGFIPAYMASNLDPVVAISSK